ncbi:MAG: PEP-CTERM sorting domain-containing protein [Limisphaerales bacterium]
MKKTYNQLYYLVPVALAACTLTVRAQLIHEYSFNDGTANDAIGGANGILVGTIGGGPTVSGGQLQLNNPNFSGPGSAQNYLSLSPGILPSSGSATIEEWFTFTGSGFFTEAYAFSDNNHDANPPGASSGQYLMGVISAPQPATPPGGANTGGSHISQSLAGYGGGAETDAYGTTPGLGAGGGGYLDDGGTYMLATVIDGGAGTLSYYLYRVSDGVGGLQQTIAAIPLSSYSFTDAYLGRSAFAGDNSTSGSIDEFRIYNDAQSASAIAADFAAGPNVVPEPASMALFGLGGFAMMLVFRRRSGANS